MSETNKESEGSAQETGKQGCCATACCGGGKKLFLGGVIGLVLAAAGFGLYCAGKCTGKMGCSLPAQSAPSVNQK